MSNLTYAFRTLRNTPVVTLVAVASLALGIGANTAIFSMFDQILLRRLPVPQPERLVNLTANGPRYGSDSTNNAGNQDSIFSYPMFRDLEKQQTVFTGIAAHCGFGVSLSYKNQASTGSGMFVSGSYFPVLQLVPAAGRLLTPDDDRTPGAHRVAVLSHRYWTRQLNSNPAVVNETLLVDGIPFTVIGVAPEGFSSTTLASEPEVFVPISMREALESGWKGLADRRSYWVYLFARLKDGTSLEQAQAAVNPLFHGIIEATDLPLQKGMSDATKLRFRNQTMTLVEGSRGQSQVLEAGKAPLLLLFGITCFVLLIACANIANLLLGRGVSRAREVSIRLALGAKRQQLVMQFLAESMLLSLGGALLGLLVASVTIRVMIAFLPPQAAIPLSPDINPRTLFFALVIALSTGFLFGLYPALRSTRQDLVTAIKDGAGSVSAVGATARFHKALVVGQIALSLLLLISAGLFLKSLVNITRVDLGMRTQGVLVFGLAPDRNQYKPAQTLEFYKRLEDSIASIPGVETITTSTVPLIAGSNWGTDVSIDGFLSGPDIDSNTNFSRVGPGFFTAMRVPILAGRDFSSSDGLDAPKVAIVNEAFARKFSNGSSVLGKRVKTGSDGKNDIEIVGLVRETKYSSVKQKSPPLLYLPYRQDKALEGAYFYVLTRANTGAASLGPAVRQAVAELDPNLPVADMTTFEEQVRNSVFVDRMVTSMSLAFALLATVLASIGLYGVLSYSIARRRREIGIRLAIGADPASVRAMVLKDVGIMALVGTLLGVPAAIALGRLASSQLYEIKAYDPVVVVCATLLIGLVTMLAGYLPARVAMGIDPQTALRND